MYCCLADLDPLSLQLIWSISSTKDKPLLPWFEGQVGFRYLPETGPSHLHHVCAALGLLSHSFRVKDMIVLRVDNIKDTVW